MSAKQGSAQMVHAEKILTKNLKLQVITFELPGVQPSKLVLSQEGQNPVVSDFDSQEQAVEGMNLLAETFNRIKQNTAQELLASF